MSRIQRARALRLGFILVSLLCASVASARPEHSPTTGTDEALKACWASGPATPEHLGPCLGMSPAEIGAKPVIGLSRAKAARCDAKASLDYRLAELVGVDPDAAWEDSFAACVSE